MITIFFALLLAANPAPAPEAPKAPAWTFTTGKNDDGEPYRAISRSSPPFEIEYRVVEDYIPNLTIRIRETCNGGDWYNQHSIGTESDQLGNTLEAANDTLAEAVKACGLDPHVADHAMDGFIEAYQLVIPEDDADTSTSWNAMTQQQRQEMLDSIADQCKLARSAFKLMEGGELLLQPDPASNYESFDCALEKLKEVRDLPKMGFLGNEAPEEQGN